MRMRAGATTRDDIKYVKIATRLTGRTPGEMTNSSANTVLKSIWIGIVTENCPYMTCPDLAHHAKYKSHSNIVSLRQRWYELTWKDRHGWLMLAEMMKSPHSVSAGATNAMIIQKKVKELAEFFLESDKPVGVGKDGFLP
tara:strand:- start:1496 stop:1915 length:420 start_codon:yes stop_codon:yes gene_type:complete